MQLLNDFGITTIKQLYEMPLEKLAEIKSIGAHYAKLIKISVTEYYREKQKKLPGETISAKERKIEEINRDLQKKIKRLNKSLSRVNEDLKPLWKKNIWNYILILRNDRPSLKPALKLWVKVKRTFPKRSRKISLRD